MQWSSTRYTAATKKTDYPGWIVKIKVFPLENKHTRHIHGLTVPSPIFTPLYSPALVWLTLASSPYNSFLTAGACFAPVAFMAIGSPFSLCASSFNAVNMASLVSVVRRSTSAEVRPFVWMGGRTRPKNRLAYHEPQVPRQSPEDGVNLPLTGTMPLLKIFFFMFSTLL